MGWREWMDAQMAAGAGPEDTEEPADEPPSEIVVTVMLPTTFRDADTGELTVIDAPQSRAWPVFCGKAAIRWARYWERRRGKGNVWIEYE